MDIFKNGDEVYVKDIPNELPVSAIFVKYNEDSLFKFTVIKRGNDYESKVNYCKLKGINKEWY